VVRGTACDRLAPTLSTGSSQVLDFSGSSPCDAEVEVQQQPGIEVQFFDCIGSAKIELRQCYGVFWHCFGMGLIKRGEVDERAASFREVRQCERVDRSAPDIPSRWSWRAHLSLHATTNILGSDQIQCLEKMFSRISVANGLCDSFRHRAHVHILLCTNSQETVLDLHYQPISPSLITAKGECILFVFREVVV
jgi:hypothetical protein